MHTCHLTYTICLFHISHEIFITKKLELILWNSTFSNKNILKGKLTTCAKGQENFECYGFNSYWENSVYISPSTLYAGVSDWKIHLTSFNSQKCNTTELKFVWSASIQKSFQALYLHQLNRFIQDHTFPKHELYSKKTLTSRDSSGSLLWTFF